MTKKRSDAMALLVTGGVVLAIWLSMIWFQAWQEAATFRRLTGKPATAWDAFWADLRVVGEAGGGK